MRLCISVFLVMLFSSPVGAIDLRLVEVEGTAFKVTLNDGRVLRSPDLVGATITIGTNGRPLRLHLDAVERDPDAVNGEVWLHNFSVQAADGTWHNICDAGPDGRHQGFPLAGRPRPDGAMEPAESGTFELVCTGGARGKCVRFGYRPWESAAMLATYNACVRMVRADYCGDGSGTTRDGVLIDVYDDYGIQRRDEKDVLAFEAGWNAEGAVCVRHLRVKENISFESLITACPRLKNHIGENCTEDSARPLGARLFNRSNP